MELGFIYHDKFLEHKTAGDHPERVGRLVAILDKLKATGQLESTKRLEFGPATPADIASLHDADYIERVRASCERGVAYMDSMDTPICGASYEAAALAVGGVRAACDAVMAGEVGRAFCAVRPPGHHAEYAHAMGFCLFNNVALAAEHLLRRHGVERVAIVDFDVHHCNGTQHTFYDRSDVLVASMHEHPRFQFPGTGFEHETGSGDGCGTTVNCPLLPGAGDDAVREAFEGDILPAIDRFSPQFLLISAGFDAHAHDPLGGLHVSDAGFVWMAERLREAALQHCDGRIISVLEGGYDLDTLARAVSDHVGALAANMS